MAIDIKVIRTSFHTLWNIEAYFTSRSAPNCRRQVRILPHCLQDAHFDIVLQLVEHRKITSFYDLGEANLYWKNLNHVLRLIFYSSIWRWHISHLKRIYLFVPSYSCQHFLVSYVIFYAKEYVWGTVCDIVVITIIM